MIFRKSEKSPKEILRWDIKFKRGSIQIITSTNWKKCPPPHFHRNDSLVLQLYSKSNNHPSKECVLYFSDNSVIFQTKVNNFSVSFSRPRTKFARSHFWDRDQNFSQQSNDWNNFISLILASPKYDFQDVTLERWMLRPRYVKTSTGWPNEKYTFFWDFRLKLNTKNQILAILMIM